MKSDAVQGEEQIFHSHHIDEKEREAGQTASSSPSLWRYGSLVQRQYSDGHGGLTDGGEHGRKVEHELGRPVVISKWHNQEAVAVVDQHNQLHDVPNILPSVVLWEAYPDSNGRLQQHC